MNKPSTLIAFLLCFSTGCAGTIQFASISQAYKKFENGNYEKTLVLITQAEAARELSTEQKAEMTYLKAQTYEALGHAERATALYEYVQEQHPNSQYAYLARRKLAADNQNSLKKNSSAQAQKRFSNSRSDNRLHSALNHPTQAAGGFASAGS